MSSDYVPTFDPGISPNVDVPAQVDGVPAQADVVPRQADVVQSNIQNTDMDAEDTEAFVTSIIVENPFLNVVGDGSSDKNKMT